MKALLKTCLLVLLSSAVSFQAQAKSKTKYKKKRDAMSRLNSLGANEDILERVSAYRNKHKVQVVQKRAVPRDNRIEFAAGYGILSGGDPYTNTKAWNLQANYHFSPRWSIGYRYNNFNNSLNAEGANIFSEAESVETNTYVVASVPELDNMLFSHTAAINWYPIYGKLNFFDMKVAQFDIYLLAEAGILELDRSGQTNTFSAGGGIGIWFTKNISTRFEMKYNTYTDLLKSTKSDPRSQEAMVFNFSVGFLL